MKQPILKITSGRDPEEVKAEIVRQVNTLIASAAPGEPPSAWFENPGLDGPTPFTVTKDGRVYGHLATWGTCHIGLKGGCVTAPKSRSQYAYFRTGQVLTAEGTTVPVGRITVGTGHAAFTASSAEAAGHYDNTGWLGALVVAGEDKFGIWVAGTIKTGLSAEQLQVLRAAPLSGDWRKVGGRGGLELVGALSVNIPGFPIPTAKALLASAGGEPLALTGINAVTKEDYKEHLARRVNNALGRKV